jgi:hypothetical protein
MITQELINYVKTQLSSGVVREKITSDLLGQGGWTMEQISEAFGYVEQSIPTQMSTQGAGAYMANNTKWSKVIPRINKIFTIVSVGVFVVVVLSFGGLGVFTSDLAVFAFAMLGTIIVIGAINYFETFSLAKRYANSNSRLDTWFTVLAVLRNLVLFLSVLPFIQIIGMVAMMWGGIPYLIVYYFMVRSRNKSVVAL